MARGTNISHPDAASRPDLVKVVFDLPRSDWHNYATESLWALVAGESTFRLRNVPFCVYGVSYDDVVFAAQADEQLIVKRVIAHSGHSTYRLFLTDGERSKQFGLWWAPLQRAGCTFERATTRLFSVDIPPNADLHEAYAALSAGDAADVWDFEEAHVGHRTDTDPD